VANKTNHQEILPAADWEPYFHKARVRISELQNCKSERSKSIRIGKFLAPMIGRSVPIQHQGRTGTAELRVVEGRGREKRYGFLIRWDQSECGATQECEGTTSIEANIAPKPARKGKPTITVNKSTKSRTASGKTATKTPKKDPTLSDPVTEPKSKARPGAGNKEEW
jgi:hypothetical protein